MAKGLNPNVSKPWVATCCAAADYISDPGFEPAGQDEADGAQTQGPATSAGSCWRLGWRGRRDGEQEDEVINAALVAAERIKAFCNMVEAYM